MESIFDIQFISILLVCPISLLFLHLIFFKKSPPNDQCVHLPPSPPSLPLVGHLHLLVSTHLPARLKNLSSKYGPLLYLRFLGFPVVLVSSASVAYQVFRTEDVNFSNHSVATLDDSLFLGPYSFMASPYGDYWKFVKKLLATDLLGPNHLARSRRLRAEEFDRFYIYLLEKATRGELVDIAVEIRKLSNKIVCNMIMGQKCSEENGTEEKLGGLAKKSIHLCGKIFTAKGLRSISRFGASLLEREVREASRTYDELLEKSLKEHEENPDREHKDMMDMLLEACQNEKAPYKITRNQIKSIFVDLLFGTNDSPPASVSWTMAELMNHPDVFRKLRKEIEFIVGKTRVLEETDLQNLPYLQAVVKEGLRLYPPTFFLPRKCQEGCEIGGYYIPKNTTVVLNLYGIMRDPSSWEDPDEFRPERFLESTRNTRECDYKEHALKHIPFGSGRRRCPGANLANIVMETAIGRMVQCFDWKIHGGKVNMEPTNNGFMEMRHPLLMTPVLHFHPLPSTQYD